MRKFIILLVSSFILAVSPIIISDVFADTPILPGGDGGSPGGGDLPVGGGSPIAGGFIILATLGAAYGVKQIYSYRNSDTIE